MMLLRVAGKRTVTIRNRLTSQAIMMGNRGKNVVRYFTCMKSKAVKQLMLIRTQRICKQSRMVSRLKYKVDFGCGVVRHHSEQLRVEMLPSSKCNCRIGK